jgi:hypothetical protein
VAEDEKMRDKSDGEEGDGGGDAVAPNREVGFGSGLGGGVRHFAYKRAFGGFHGGSVVNFGLGQLF